MQPLPLQPEFQVSASLDQGVREFNIGRFWHAHEDWEKAWMRLSGAEKTALQGMIQAVASFYLLEKGRYRPAKALASSSLAKLPYSKRATSRESCVEAPGLESLLREIANELPGELTPSRASEWIRRARALRAFRNRRVPAGGNSRRVVSAQNGPHPDLWERIRKVLETRFELRASPDDYARFAALNDLVRAVALPVVLDSGCGTGLSSEELARRHSDAIVIGVDRSPHRLGKAVARMTGAEGNIPTLAREIAPDVQVFGERLVIARFELSRFWAMASRAGWEIHKNYVLYPNPWPKPNALRRRWHGHEVFPLLVNLAPELEVRSNWRIYLEEFQEAYRAVRGREGILEKLTPAELKEPLTAFERKYRDSGHDLWRWRN